MFDFLLPAYVKEGKQLLIGVKKFVHQHRDLMSEEKIGAIMQARDEFAAVLETRDKEKLQKEKEHLLSVCEKAVPDYKTDSIRENIEVIIVAIVVALGIRSYIVQPFKIPTASMQPTLNGIIATRMPEGTEAPNVVAKTWDFVWSGTNYTDLRAPESSGKLAIVSVRQQAFAMLFTRTVIQFSNGESSWCYAPARQLFGELWLPENGDGPFGQNARGLPATDSFTRSDLNYPVRSGALLARGKVDTGDQVLVDKVSYHFRQPKRGEPFVFSTLGIKGIEATLPPGSESQHYIKRLVGVPNDTLELDPPYLWINGEMPKEFGIKRVIEHEGDANAALSPHVNKYHGYTMLNQRASSFEIDNANTQREGRNTITYRLRDKEYMACGDNSGNSSDSRAWGKVPQANLVGPALMVYWPFKPHAGFIK
jgi:signal peptidase I